VIKKVLRGRASIFFPPSRFFLIIIYCVFGRFSIRGTQKRDKKNHVIVRVQKFNPGQIKYVRTLVFLFFFSVAPWESVGCWLFLFSRGESVRQATSPTRGARWMLDKKIKTKNKAQRRQRTKDKATDLSRI
jgi:hypothetical protein